MILKQGNDLFIGGITFSGVVLGWIIKSFLAWVYQSVLLLFSSIIPL